MSATPEQIAVELEDLAGMLEAGRLQLWQDDVRAAAALIRAQAEREKALAFALEEIKSDAAHVIDFYNRNGPTWTGKDGHEYDDMSSVLSRAETVVQIADAALKAAP